MSKVTRKDLANHLGIDIEEVKQIKSKQLFIVKGIELYSSYTKVGVLEDEVWYLTTKKYSSSTSRQLSQFANWVRTFTLFTVEYKEI